eukprot:TRINITY_DN22363_c0_g1_i1.p2 TRINITY_DN22363_c0_g1~~TRINITY_DN22363_c0_g1_i1.p2  ORF type:complete len:119 (+),score=30.57 TRINITY_DN22363_c0_g1_i1:90-446(+)
MFLQVLCQGFCHIHDTHDLDHNLNFLGIHDSHNLDHNLNFFGDNINIKHQLHIHCVFNLNNKRNLDPDLNIDDDGIQIKHHLKPYFHNHRNKNIFYLQYFVDNKHYKFDFVDNNPIFV